MANTVVYVPSTGRSYLSGRPGVIHKGLNDWKMRDLLNSEKDPIRPELILKAKRGNQRKQMELAVALACDEYEAQ